MMEGKSAERCGAVWDQARLLYVTTGASCGQVAARLGVSKGAAERRCAAEGWVEQRKAFRKKLYEKALERAQKTGLAVMEDLMRSAESMTERFRDVVEDPQAFRRYLVSDKAGGPKREEIFQRTDMDAFRAASGTLKQMSEAVRELWGIPGMRQEESLRIARERLEMLKNRENSQVQEKVVVEIEGGEAFCG